MERNNLKFGSVHNVRDLGGIRTLDGREFRPGLFYRGAALHKLSGKDAERLAEELGVQTVIDLRTPQEQKEKPDRNVPGALLLQLPVFDEQTSGISYEKSQKLSDKVKAIPDMPALYRKMVTDPEYVSHLKEILSIMVREGIAGRPVYYHCTAGKDRTGIVSLLLLSLCDVPFEEIVADYLLTNTEPVPGDKFRVFAVSALMRDPEITASLKKVFRAEVEYLRAAADAINETYGSMDVFLRDTLDIPDRLRTEFKKKSCTP